jgi:hypothetical protein
MVLSLHSLPVELIYRIFDNLDEKTLFLSCYGICKRLNSIRDTYYRYQVIFNFITTSYSDYFWNYVALLQTIITLITFLYS